MNPQNFVVPRAENHPLSPALGDHGSAFCAFSRYAFSRVGEAVAQSFFVAECYFHCIWVVYNWSH